MDEEGLPLPAGVSSPLPPQAARSIAVSAVKTKRNFGNGGLQALVDHHGAEVRHAAGVSPLVVVPGDGFDEVAADDHGAERIEDGAAGVAFEVGGDEGLVAVTQDAPELLGGGVAEGSLTDSTVTGLVAVAEITDGDGGRQDAEGHAVDAALHLNYRVTALAAPVVVG